MTRSSNERSGKKYAYHKKTPKASIRENTNRYNKVSKKGGTVIGHSMVKFVKFENFSEENYDANIQRNRDCTTKDVADYIKTIIRRKPDILVYTGTNNLTNSVNAMNKVKKIVKTVE